MKKSHSGLQYTAALAGLVLAAMLAASCASGPYVQNEPGVYKLVDLINKGGINEVKGLSDAPFLFDGEILLLSDDVNSLWNNLKSAGFKLEGAKIASIERLGADSYKAFADSLDARVFFSKYLNQDTSLVRIAAQNGVWLFLLNREVAGFPRIQGMRGPVK
jgi:hypothetical protein